MVKNYDKKLVLENGDEYFGYGFGGNKEVVSNLIYTKNPTGYQEIITNPGYKNKNIIFTYPLIGNYGIADSDYESKNIHVNGVILREYNDSPSNFRYTKTLDEIMLEDNVSGIYGIDTRKLVKSLESLGTVKSLICSVDVKKEEALEKIKNFKEDKRALAQDLSCKKRWYQRTANPILTVVVIDFGVKLSLIRELNKRHINVTIMPYNSNFKDIEEMKPDGIIFSNGGGSPIKLLENNGEISETIENLIGKYPILAIDYGSDLIGLTLGMKVEKLKNGYFGSFPVRDVKSLKIETTTQKREYKINEEDILKNDFTIIKRNLIDNEPAFIANPKKKLYLSKFDIEGSPGESQVKYIFDDFIDLMRGDK